MVRVYLHRLGVSGDASGDFPSLETARMFLSGFGLAFECVNELGEHWKGPNGCGGMILEN